MLFLCSGLLLQILFSEYSYPSIQFWPSLDTEPFVATGTIKVNKCAQNKATQWTIALPTVYSQSQACPKAKAIQSRVREQNNCPNLGNKSASSRIPTEKATFRPESYLMFCNTCMNENTLLVCTCFWWIHLFPPAARRQTQLTAQAKNVPGNFPVLTY